VRVAETLGAEFAQWLGPVVEQLLQSLATDDLVWNDGDGGEESLGSEDGEDDDSDEEVCAAAAAARVCGHAKRAECECRGCGVDVVGVMAVAVGPMQVRNGRVFSIREADLGEQQNGSRSTDTTAPLN
jgi:hypothetical protein